MRLEIKEIIKDEKYGEIIYNENAWTGKRICLLSQGLKWYEYVLSVLPFILILIWGNSVALCEIVPVVGGFVGGLISAVFSFLNLIILKKLKNIWLKVLVSVVTLGLTFLVCFLIALAILGAVA